jgi:OOP family OmpA-OmpF porin
MTRMLKMAAPVLAAAALAACGTADVQDARDLNVQGTAFNDNLARNYRDLALFEADEMYDWKDAPWFARKANLAAAGKPVAATSPTGGDTEFDIPEARRAELITGYQRLDAVMRSGARTRYPALAATAQAKYDCWVEQSEEDWQYDHIASCRDDFNLAMERMETKATMDAGPPVLIFFDWNQATLEREAIPIVDQLAKSLRDGEGGIKITGHADTSGPRDYNYRLGMRRAETVAGALRAQGVDGDRMTLTSEGEADLRVPTADGVREPQNRRVTVEATAMRPAMASR